MSNRKIEQGKQYAFSLARIRAARAWLLKRQRAGYDETRWLDDFGRFMIAGEKWTSANKQSFLCVAKTHYGTGRDRGCLYTIEVSGKRFDVDGRQIRHLQGASTGVQRPRAHRGADCVLH